MSAVFYTQKQKAGDELSDGRSYTVSFNTKADTKGITEMQRQLKNLQKSMSENKQEQKSLSKEVSSAEKEIVKIQKQIKKTGETTDEQKKRLEDLNDTVSQGKDQLEKLKLQQAQLQNQINATNQKITAEKNALEQLKTSMSDAKENAKSLAIETAAIEAAITAAVAAIFKFTSDAALWADDINTLSSVTGISTGELQKFAYASDLIDVSMETMTGSLTKLTRSMSTASENGTSRAAKSFDELGISISDSTGKLRDRQTVFYEAIDALGKIENETERDAIAMNIFGKSAQELNPLIKGGAKTLKELGDEAEKAGLILSQETLDGLNEFNDKIDLLKSKGDAVQKVVASQMTPALDGLVEVGEELLDEINKLAQSGELKKMAEELGKSIKNGAEALKNIIGFIWNYKEAIGAVAVAMVAFKAAMTISNLVNSLVVGFQALKIATDSETTSMGALNAVMDANPIGLVVSAIAALTAGLVTFALTTSDSTDAVEEMNEALDEISNTANDTINNAEAEASLISELGKRYEELRQKQNLSATEQTELANIAEQLAQKMGLTTEELRDQAGGYKDLSKEIENYSKILVAKAKVEATTEAYKEAYKKQLEVKQELVDGYKELSNELGTVYDKETGELITDTQNVSYEQMAQFEGLAKLGKAYESASETVDAYSAEIEEAQNELAELQQATDDLGKKTTETGGSTETLAKSTADAASAAEVYKQKLNDAVKELVSNTEAQKTQRDTVNKLRKEVDEMADAVAGLTENEKGYTEQDLYEKQQEYLKAQEGLAELNTEETYLRDNIRSIKDAIKDTGDTGISYLDALSNAAKNLRGSLSDLAGSYEKLNGGQTLSYTTLLDLVDKYPEYATQLANAAGNADLQKAAIEALFNAKKQDYILTQQAAIDNIKASKKEAEETIKCIKAVIEAIGVKDGIFTTMYSSMLQNLINDVAGYDSELGTLQAKIDLMNGISIDSFSSSGGSVSSGPTSSGSSGSSGTSGGPSGSDGRTKYTTTVGYSWKGESYNASYDFYEGDDTSTLDADARAKALLGVLDRAKSLGKVSTQEEIDFLNDLLSNADLGAMSEDQRYQIRQKLYAAQNGKSETEKLTKTYTSKWKGEEAQASYDYYEGQDTAAQDADTMAKSQLAVLDRAKALGKVTAQEEVDFLKKVLEIEGLSADQQYQIRVKLYQAENTLAAEQEKKREEAAQKAAEAEKKAAEELLERQKLALAAYNKLVEDKIDAYNKQAQAAKDAADAEIEALNKELAARKQAKEDENRQEKLDQINARLRYEQMDEFTRGELERAKQDLLNEIAEVNYERSIEKRKEEIRAEADAVSERSKEAIERLKASQEDFANRMAEMQGTQTYDQRVEHNSIAKNITIVQNGLNGNQLMNKILRELY